MIGNRRFERINKLTESKSCIKNESIPENKEIFIYGFKHIERGKLEGCLKIGCESHKLCEKNKLFNFSSFINVNKGIAT